MEKLYILWVNDNPQTAHTMILMYAMNAKSNNWVEDIEVIIWGPSAKLVANDVSIQEKIKMAQHVGVSVKACISCANQFAATEKLLALGVVVAPMGEHLTGILQENERLITI